MDRVSEWIVLSILKKVLFQIIKSPVKLSSLPCQSKVSEFVLTSKLSHIGLKLGAFQNNEGERAKTCLSCEKMAKNIEWNKN